MADSGNVREFDLVLWGCTGFTGRGVARYISRTYGLPTADFRYAVAGRSAAKLDALEEVIVATAPSQKNPPSDRIVPKIVADLSDSSSIESLCRRTKCVVSLAGPYAEVGEPVVKACAENGTHYVDITGELKFVRQMRQSYHEMAKAHKAKLIMCCGFDYVPNDLSMHFLHGQLGSRSLTLLNVKQFLFLVERGFSGGTAASIVNMIEREKLSDLAKNDQWIMCEERPSDPATVKNSVTPNGLGRSSELSVWTCPHIFCRPMAAYLRWSNEIQNSVWGRDFALSVFDTAPHFFKGLYKTIRITAITLLLVACAKGPAFLRRWFLPQQGSGTFELDDDKNDLDEPKAKIVTVAQVKDASGMPKQAEVQVDWQGEPYALTCVTATEAALTAVFNVEAAPATFGVLSPAAAFGDAFVGRLAKRGVAFTVNGIR